jgi:hypothetical protein
MRSGWNGHVVAMVVLAGLFSLRIAGQAVQYWAPQVFLPDFGAFQGSSLPYVVLLAFQLIILGLMVRTLLRVHHGNSVPNRRIGRYLAWFGGIYMAGSILRIAVGLAIPSAPAWFSTWIPALFHLVLAGFVIAAANFHLRHARAANNP